MGFIESVVVMCLDEEDVWIGGGGGGGEEKR